LEFDLLLDSHNLQAVTPMTPPLFREAEQGTPPHGLHANASMSGP